jgi:hypothetical protein
MKPPRITVVCYPDHNPDTMDAIFEQALESMPSPLERTVTAAGVVSLVALVVVLCVRFVF